MYWFKIMKNEKKLSKKQIKELNEICEFLQINHKILYFMPLLLLIYIYLKSNWHNNQCK